MHPRKKKKKKRGLCSKENRWKKPFDKITATFKYFVKKKSVLEKMLFLENIKEVPGRIISQN